MLGAVAEGRLRSGAYVGSVRVPLGMNGRANRCGQRGRSLQASPSGFRRRQQRAQRPLPLRQAQRPAHQEWVFSQRLPQAASQGQPDWAHMEGPRTCRSTSRPAFSWRNSRQRLHQRQYPAPTESSSCSWEKQSFLIWNVLQAAIIASRFVKDDSPCGPAQT